MIDKDHVLVEVSNRHIHLSEEHLYELFGDGYKLIEEFGLSQPKQYAARQRVDLYNPSEDRWLRGVRVLGPTRKETQVEVSGTEARQLKIYTADMYRLSGTDLTGTPGIRVYGTEGRYVDLPQGVIIAKPHIHISEEDAAQINVKHEQHIDVKIDNDRPRTFHDVIVRVGKAEDVGLAVHIDSDEGNSAHIENRTYGKIIIP